MAYLLGRDVKVAITTENDGLGMDWTAASGTVAPASGATGTGMVCRGIGSDSATDDTDIFGTNTTNYATNPLNDVTGVDLTLGAIDEDVAYMGQRTALKAEIKKETTCAITLKKGSGFWDAMFNDARWGMNSSDVLTDMGLQQPDLEFGYRLHVALKDDTEVITLKGCTLSEHSVSLSADGVQEETITFVSHILPEIDADPISEKITTALL